MDRACGSLSGREVAVASAELAENLPSRTFQKSPSKLPFMGWFLTGGALLQNCSRCLEKLLVDAGHHGAAELGSGEAACAAGARHRPGSVEKYTSMMTGLEREKREAEQQGD